MQFRSPTGSHFWELEWHFRFRDLEVQVVAVEELAVGKEAVLLRHSGMNPDLKLCELLYSKAQLS